MAWKGITRPGWEDFRSALQYYLPAVIVIFAVAVSIIYADNQKREVHQDAQRVKVAERLSSVRARLEGNINANIQLVRGFVATLETEPDLTAGRFHAIARRIFANSSQLRSVAGAPDLKVAYIYPQAGNENVVGLDYRQNPTQKRAAEQARDTGQIVVTGPVDLVQGGRGLIVRYPVVTEIGRASRTFWGILSAVIDIERLYADSGLVHDDQAIRIAISSRRADGSHGEVFFGDPAIMQQTPIDMGIYFGQETWQISAIPKLGWDALPDDIWRFRALMTVIGVMIMAPVLWVASLLRERHANIGTLRQREEELRALSHRLEIALEASKIGVWEIDIGSGELYWDSRMRALYGMGKTEKLQTYDGWCASIHADDREATENCLAQSVATGRDYSTQFRIVLPSGEIRYVRALGTIYRDSRFRKKFVGVSWNVTSDIALQQQLIEAKRQSELQNQELELARRHMEHNSLHDALTEMPNRRYLDQHLKDIDGARQETVRHTLLHIDLDRFKEINDTLGHGAGDAILKHVALKLRENIRQRDFAARIGGDEFVVVCAGSSSDEEDAALARRLIDAVNSPVVYAGQECRVGASIGIASRTDRSQGSGQLLVNADIALYEAKRHGRNRVEHYREAMKWQAVESKQTADAILKSIEQNDFVAWYQPQFDAHTLEISGVEALARWQHPERGILPPAAFLHAAEDLNVVSKIDAAVLDQALFQSARWDMAGLRVPKVSVNISGQRLFDEALFDHLRAINLPKGRFSFELLESISFDDKNDAIASAISRIRDHGIDIEIDDFGTGYASILSLLKLSPRRLKIDRQLVMPVIDSAAQRRLVGSIVEIGRSLSIEIVAEGVETMRHAEILRDLGCHTLQGYAFARPMSAESFMEFCASYKGRPTDLDRASA